MPAIRRSFVVIGLGTFGRSVASELARFGDHVLGIGINERNVNDLADTLAEAVIADGRDVEALREAGVANYDVAVIAIGEDLEANLLCTMNVRMLGVPAIWVKATHRTHQRILTELGADRIIQPEQEIGQHIAQVLHNPLVRDYLDLCNGRHIFDFMVPEQLNERVLGDLKLSDRFEIRCLGLMRGEDFLHCDSVDIELQTDDRLLLLGRRKDLREFADSI